MTPARQTDSVLRADSALAASSSAPVSARASGANTQKLLELGSCLALFLIPVRLSLTYLVLLPCLLVWLSRNYKTFSLQLRKDFVLVAPFVWFLCAALASSTFGLDPLRSTIALSSIAFYGLSFFLFRDLLLQRGPLLPLSCLLAGHMLPALYAITNATLGTPWGDLFHGKVTQSGQLTLSFTLAIGTAFGLAQFSSKLSASQHRQTCSLSAGLFVCLLLLAFSTELGLNNTQRPLLLVPLLAMVLLAWTRICSIPKGSSDRLWIALVAFAIPIMAVTLMINLKRGPWLGSACALLIFFFLYSRRLLLPMLLLLGAAAVSIAPIRTRLAQSTNDFLIPGGRSVIWQIGEDLLMRYPLGVGFKNSAFLQKFSTIIPPELTHFHNNFLNIIVETGWLAFPLFLYWLFVLYRRGLQLRGPSLQGAIAVAAGCALLAWQVAGLVEYNFGDSEVLLLAFFCVSLLSSAALVQRKPL